jgi:hypothetical protein
MSIMLCFMAGAILTLMRSNLHSRGEVWRNAAADLLSGAFAWPIVIVHMQLECDLVGSEKMNRGEFAAVEEDEENELDV